MLTELAVVLCLDFLSVALAVALARWTLRRGTPGPESRRLVNAATRASEAFLLREGKLAAVGTALAVTMILGLRGALLLRHVNTPLSTALWTTFAALLGASLTVLVAYLTMAVGLRATLRTVRAAEASLDQAAALSLRAAGVAAFSAEALGAGAVAGLLGLVYLVGGGGAAASVARATVLFERAATVLPGLALGSLATAVVLGLGGSAYRVTASAPAAEEFGVDVTDPRNPSMVANLVGDHVGTGVRRAVDLFTAATLANVAGVVLGVAAFRINAGASGSHAWALVTLPLVARSVGVVGSAFGLFTAKVEEAERASLALWRGLLTATILAIGGIGGASFWLVGGTECLWVGLGGVLGVLTAVWVGHTARRGVDRRSESVQGVLDASRAGHASAIARGVAVGCRGTLLQVALAALALCASFNLGEHSHLPGGGLLGTSMALSGFLALSPYLLAVGLFGPIVSGVIGIAALEPDANRPEVRRRAAVLEDAGFQGGRVAESFFIALGGMAAVVAGLGIPLASASPDAVPLSLDRPLVIWSGALGTALIIAFAGRALEIAARGARATTAEVERQLRAFPREAGVAQIPEGYTPSYRALIDIASRASVDGLLAPALLGLVAPAVLGFGLRVLYMSPALAVEGLTAFVAIAAATGLGAALAADGASAVLEVTCRENRSGGNPSALAGYQIGSFIGETGRPAAQLFIKTFAATALVIAPMLIAS